MKAAGEHGLEIPGVIKDIISDRDDQCLDQLTVHYNDNDAVDDVSNIYVSSKSLIIHRPLDLILVPLGTPCFSRGNPASKVFLLLRHIASLQEKSCLL